MVAFISAIATIAASFMQDGENAEGKKRVCMPPFRNFLMGIKNSLSAFRNGRYLKMWICAGIMAFTISLNGVMVRI